MEGSERKRKVLPTQNRSKITSVGGCCRSTQKLMARRCSGARWCAGGWCGGAPVRGVETKSKAVALSAGVRFDTEVDGAPVQWCAMVRRRMVRWCTGERRRDEAKGGGVERRCVGLRITLELSPLVCADRKRKSPLFSYYSLIDPINKNPKPNVKEFYFSQSLLISD
ncbi:hypothetical protein U1Q18_005107 [Sarracenia purpurea var. burkii]